MGVNYDAIADAYDRHRKGGGPYLDTLVTLARRSAAERVLEVGAGTGNNTASFLEAYPCALTALEPSGGMLRRAADKRLPVRWVRASAETIPFERESFHFVFGIYMLHYMHPLESFFRECRRVLRNGYAAFVTAPVSFIANHPMNAYFPSFAAVDLGRFRPESDIIAAMASAGFQEVHALHLKGEPCPIDEGYAARIAGKFISTYELLPPGEFETGLARLKNDIAQKGQLDIPMIWEGVVIAGRAGAGVML